MPISLSKRSFIKGLFVAPAIIAANNLMPVKAMDMIIKPDGWKPGPLNLIMAGQNVGKSKLITDLAEIQEASSLTTTQWQLYTINGHLRWLTPYNAEHFKYERELIKTVDIPHSNREIDTTVALMKAEPGSSVIWGDIPGHLRRY
jgi:hypothetical protein